MPAIPLKKILSVSSEDKVHKAANLLLPAASLHWISSTENQSKCSIVELEMAKMSKIGQIEIGNLGSAFVEVLVRETESSGDYVSLLPQSMLMTAEESKSGRNQTRTKVFGQDRLSKAATDKKWRYIKIQCLQPYLPQKPYGLRYIKLFQTSQNLQGPETGSPSLCGRSPLNSLLSPIKNLPKFNTPQHLRTHSASSPQSLLKRGSTSAPLPPLRTPKLPALSIRGRGGDVADGNGSATPKRPRKEQVPLEEDSQEFEFAGLENQSRLLKGTLKGNNKELVDANPILSRIASTKKEKEEEEVGGASYVRRRLLTKELNNVDNSGVDFISSYDDKVASLERSKTSRIYTHMKLSKLDDSSEIGDETCLDRSRWTKRRRDRQKSSDNGRGWIKRRGGGGRGRRLGPLPRFAPVEMSDIPLLLETKQSKLLDFFNNEASGDEDGDDTDSDATVEYTCDDHDDDDNGKIAEDKTESSSSFSSMQSCPICNEPVPLYALELHASQCAEKNYDSPSNNRLVTERHVTINSSHYAKNRSKPGIIYID